MFDPYSCKITHVDQWITITRLPQEYWEDTQLASLLAGVGIFLRVDEYAMTRGKGKFARVCLNIDITKPLRGTLTIPTPDTILQLPISYESLHEVCAICGSTSHALEACPDSPSNVFEVVVEKFGATTLKSDSGTFAAASGPQTAPLENWMTVSPKKRSKLPNAHRKRSILPTPSCFATPKVTTVNVPAPIPTVILSDTSTCGGVSVAKDESFLEQSNLVEHGLNVAPAFMPEHDPDLAIDNENDMDMFLNLEGGDEPQHSFDSTKKRRFEEEEELSSSFTYM